MLEDDLIGSRRSVFLRALRLALGRAPLWLLTWIVGLLAAAIPVIPWVQWFAGTTEGRYEPGSLLATLPEVFRHDHGGALGRLRESGGAVLAGIALCMMLVGVFTGGGWLQVFLERTSGHSVRRFLWGGAKYFWRFLRVWLLTVVVLSFASWVVFDWPWKTLVNLLVGPTDNDMEVVTSEWTAVWIGWIQAGLFAVALGLVLVWADYTRTRLALHDGRSAVWSGLCSFFLMVVHPVRTVRPMALLLLLEIAVIVGLGKLSWSLNVGLGPETGGSDVLYLLVLGQLGMLWQHVSRAARYAAAVQVSHLLVAPLPQPDPWASRIGGPGGPQYPVDDTDDYGVSI